MIETFPTVYASILQFLGSQTLYEGISQNSLVQLAKASRLKDVPQGGFIFLQGDPADHVYMVWRGVIALRLENADGREMMINEMGVGEIFGELAILTGEPRSTSAEALVDSEILIIPGPVFKMALEVEHSLALHLLEITARRLHDSSKREEALAFYDAQQRLARLLLILDSQAADKGYLTISQDELAARLGLARQTVAIILGRWRRNGWLLTGRGHVVLLNHHELMLLNPNQEIIFSS